ncbi:biotin transporter BioY [Desulfatirhabdium butyrativorans]|uniref:biotin transporter BioY n=1 Tax=Desulfatirhabdium butyrativorans TaxID=340467 RepID=UPI000409BA15|nr:biotin transporter BioY [Desulfatirhabdium butyrativorans]
METVSKFQPKTPVKPEAMRTSLKMGIFAALFASLMAAGAYIAIPIGPVPIVLQNLFVMLAALMLGARWATISVGIYLFAGAIGFPVFSGATGGIARFIGPTGGYLIGFLLNAFVSGIAVEKLGDRWMVHICGMVLGTSMLYMLGAGYLKWITAMSWEKAIAVGVLPFVIGDGFKIAAAAAIYRLLSAQFPIPRKQWALRNIRSW